MKLRGEEIQRKILHGFTGIIYPAGIFFLPHLANHYPVLPSSIPGWAYPTIVLAIVQVFFFVMEYLRFRVPAVQKMVLASIGGMMRQEEKVRMTGATYINASALICSVLFRNYPHISVMVLSSFIWGDAIAALIGQSMGKTKIGSKSLEGSLSCFALCMGLFVVGFPAVPGLLEPWSGKIPFFVALVGSLSITVLELFPIRLSSKYVLNDNLTVPIVTGILLIGMHALIG